MHGNEFFYQAFIYLSAAVLAVPIAKRLGLGSVLGYLIAGIIIGPFVLGFVGAEGQDVMHFAEFGVVMMLFLIGLELQPSLLWRMRLPILGIGGSQVVVTTIIITGLVMFFTNLVWQTALAIGLTLALSSTAIVLQTLTEKGLLKSEGGQNAFSVLLFQDIAVIPILAIMPLLAISEPELSAGHHETWIESIPLVLRTIIVFGVVIAIIFAGKYLIGPAFRLIAQTRLRELFTAAALLLIISIALLMTQVGLSPALGTFLAGVILAQSEYRHELESDIEPFKGLLLGLFFISVGSSIDFKLIVSEPDLIAYIVAALIVVKILVLFVIGKLFKMSTDNNLLFTFSLAQAGEFAFVLFSYGLQNGVISTEVASPLIASVAISMALTPLLILLNEKILQPRFGTLEKEEIDADTIDQKCKIIIAGFGRFGSTIGRFLQANGATATYLDIDPNNVDLLRNMGFKVFYGDASRHDLLTAAGAADATLLIVAVNDQDKILDIVNTAEKHFPHLKIITRAKSWESSYPLFQKNVDGVYLDYLDTALRIGEEALSKMGHRKYQVHRAALKFRKHDEEFISKLAEQHASEHNFFESSKNHMLDLEQLMLDDLKSEGQSKDKGWDASSMREELRETQKKKQRKRR